MTDISILKNTIESMVSDADDRGEKDFGLRLTVEDAFTLCKLQPVVHGHWIFSDHRWICSECHENPTFGMGYVQSERSLYAYCPHCGAKMDE